MTNPSPAESSSSKQPFAHAPEPQFCGHCGKPWGGHSRCDEALALEPPRYCTQCARRMKVQVSPTGWRATCSQHGALQQ